MTGKPHIVMLSDSAHETARAVRAATGGTIESLRTRCQLGDLQFDDTKARLQSLFRQGEPIVGVMAAGAMIRLLAPLLADKSREPAVLAVAEDGTSVVPLLGGHHGANAMARQIALAIGGHAAITTAGDLRLGVALDAPPAGWMLANPENAKEVMAKLISGEKARMEGEVAMQAEWVTRSRIPIAEDGSVALRFTRNPVKPTGNEPVFHPRDHVLGIGCERGTDSEETAKLAEEAIAKAGIASGCIACVVSIDLKADEVAVHAVADRLGVPARFFDAQTLEAETPRLKNPSDVVFAETGCHGVAEGAALAMTGKSGSLVVEKIKSKRATAAIAQSAQSVDPARAGRARGRLFVIGIGPGSADWRSPEVSRMIGASTDLVGYSLYLDLIAELSRGKTRHDFDLGKEEDRVRHAMELAGEGRDVALVCSGDAGIYAMATLVFELLESGNLSEAAKRIAIEVSPGISALQAAAARAGAPLGHDFCTISLSDLLTPWNAIRMRIKAAAEGDFVIAFYNPVSKRRRTQLAHAKEVLLRHRPYDTPVILATNLGRDGEAVRIVPLSDLEVDDVDMLTVVIVGSSETRTVKTGDGRIWTFTPRGYSAKAGTQIGKEAAQ